MAARKIIQAGYDTDLEPMLDFVYATAKRAEDLKNADDSRPSRLARALTLAFVTVRQKIDRRDHRIDSSGAVIIPPIIGAAIRCITSDPVPPPHHNRQQPGHNRRHGHHFRAHAQHRPS